MSDNAQDQTPPATQPVEEIKEEVQQQDGQAPEGFNHEQQPQQQHHHFHHHRRAPAAMLKKTRLCRGYEATGECQYGDACWFAHGQGDIREPQQFHHHNYRRSHPFAKTKMCKFMQNGGQCPYKDHCNYAHSPVELRPAPMHGGGYMGAPMDFMMRKRPIDASRYKTRLCKSFTNQGFCKFGDTCAFAHGQTDLRNNNFVPREMYNPGFQPFYGDMSNGFQQQQQPQYNMFQAGPPQNQQIPQMQQIPSHIM